MNKNQDSEEIFSIYNLLSKIKNFLYFLKTKNNQFFLGVCIAIFFTISYNYLISPTHFARTTFVLDNDSSRTHALCPPKPKVLLIGDGTK